MKIAAFGLAMIQAVDLDYFENTGEILPGFDMGNALRNGGRKNKKKKKPKKTNLPAGSKLLPSQRALQIGDNRDKVADILYWLLQNSPDSGNLPTYSDILNGYGCWCQFYDAENWASSNKGTPVDNLDTACRSWNKCYDCINRDDSTCDGISSTYSNVLYFSETSEISCELAGAEGSCERNACECDVKLAVSLYQSSIEFDDSYSSENGFDTATCIATGGGPGFAPDQCCGTYPDRFPFYSYDNTRGCCAGKTYDKDTLQCCEGGNVAVVCDGMNFGNPYA